MKHPKVIYGRIKYKGMTIRVPVLHVDTRKQPHGVKFVRNKTVSSVMDEVIGDKALPIGKLEYKLAQKVGGSKRARDYYEYAMYLPKTFNAAIVVHGKQKLVYLHGKKPTGKQLVKLRKIAGRATKDVLIDFGKVKR